MSSGIYINPYETDMMPMKKTIVIEYVKYKIDVVHFVGENRALINVTIATENEEYTKVYEYELSGNEYLLWVSDSYLKAWVKSKLSKESIL